MSTSAESSRVDPPKGPGNPDLDSDLRDYLEVLIADRLEQRILDRENKRFRMLYVVFAVVTAIGLGVFLNQIGISADAAVEKRLGETLAATEESKEFTKLLLLGTQLDVKNAFTAEQRDEATALAISLYSKPKVAADKSYVSIVESIIDALAAAGNTTQIANICRGTKTLCTDNEGIAITVMGTFGRKHLGTNGINGAKEDEVSLFRNAASSLRDSGPYQGVAWAYIVLADFHDGVAEDKILEQLKIIGEGNATVRNDFNTSVERLLDRTQMSDDPSPEIIAVERLAKRFTAKFASAMPGSNEPQQPS